VEEAVIPASAKEAVIPASAKEPVIPAYAGIQRSAWIPDHCPE